MLRNIIKTLTKKILSLFNVGIYKLNLIEPHDFTNIQINLLSAQYLVDHKSVVIRVDLNEGRTNNWFDLTDKSLDPGIFAIKNALKKNLKDEAMYEDILNTLEEYYSFMKFKNAAHSLNIDSCDNDNIKDYPWWALVNPWDSSTFEDVINEYPYEIKRNRANNGLKILSNDPNKIIKENFENGWSSHARQYVNLLNKIKHHGLKFGSEIDLFEDYGHISAEILVANKKIRWKPGKEGNHRLAVAAALGYKKIPALVTKIIRFDELEYWPNVINGTFTNEQAIKIFHNIFDAKPSKVHEDWIKKFLDKN
jgi:hypothetical protein